MKKENKEFLLKDLCGRLPYGVKCEITTTFSNKRFAQKVEVLNYLILGTASAKAKGYEDNTSIKPYLFPLSSMTEEQFKEMQEIIGNPNEACISVNTSGLKLWLNSVDTDPTIWLDTVFELQDWLNKNNFDYRGLIPKGLAIDATGLNIY